MFSGYLFSVELTAWSCKISGGTKLFKMGSQYISDETTVASSKSEDLSGNRIKFLCSFGGKFLPRPSDGQLRYVGGDTRLVTVDRSITFQDFIKKLEDVFDTVGVTIKYRLPTLDLDILISVTRDEDLQSMIEEYNKYDIHNETCSQHRVRLFLFPQNPPLPSAENEVCPKQRYVDAVNGMSPSLQKQKSPSSPLLKVPDYFSDPESNGAATEMECQSPMAPWTDDPPLTACLSSPHKQNMRKVPSEGAVISSPSKLGIELQRVHSSPSLIRGYHSNIVPVSIYNIVPNKPVLMGSHCHGRPAIIYRGGGGSTAERSLQLASQAAPRVKTVIYASNRTGSPLKYMRNQMNANKL